MLMTPKHCPRLSRLLVAVLATAEVVFGRVAWGYWPPPNQKVRQQVAVLKVQAMSEMGRQRGLEGLEAIIRDETVNESVRALAVIALGDVGGESEEEFLIELSKQDNRFGNAAQAAIWRTRLNRAQSRQEESAVLNEALHAEVGGKIPGSTRRWAAEQLCDRGDIEGKHDEIQAALRIAYGTKRGGEEMEVCQTKASLLQALGRHQMRILRRWSTVINLRTALCTGGPSTTSERATSRKWSRR